MGIRELHENLTKYGFTLEEAEVYVFLTTMGSATARNVARRFNINRVKAYRTLKELEDKGLVNKIMERPVRFMAQPIDQLIQNRILETQNKLEELTGKKNLVIDSLEAIKDQNQTVEVEPVFRIYQGRQQIYELIADMCERVTHEIRLVTTPTDFTRMSLWGIEERLKELSGKGVKVNVLTEVNEFNLREIEESHELIGIRHLVVPASVRMITIDKMEALTSVAMDDSMSMTTQNDTGLWTNAVGFTSAMQIFYDALWNSAQDSGVIISSIKTGRKPQEFVTIRTMEDYANSINVLINGSERSIDIMVNRIQDLPISLFKILQKVEHGNIRILTHVEESVNEALIQINSVADIRHSDSDLNFSLLIVDGNESLLSTKESETSFHALLSNLSDYVQTTSMIFEEYWVKSRPIGERYRELVVDQNRTEITQALQEQFKKSGWIVDTPGLLSNSIGGSHKFDLVAKIDDRVVAVNLVIEGDGYTRLFELTSIKPSLSSVILAIGSIRELDEDLGKMADLYGVKLVHSVDIEGMYKKLNDLSN